ncbi:MAG: hypothetical protein QS721_00180 [Candidatus Endonucleobacter sp. (ex Gigantidas childressi)]|nr:hypothetical protein [Candidatus Endonucleobacter sp. (ex Gigantidas childressi)]
MNARNLVINFLQGKGVDTTRLTDNDLLMRHIQSIDFMELIVTAEAEIGRELDLESVQIEEVSSLGGFVAWLEKV